MAEANTSSTQQAADAQHVDNMTSLQQSTPDAPSGARSDAPVQTNNVGTQDGPSQLNSNPTGNSTNNNNLGGGQQNSPINGGSSGNFGGGAGPGGGDAIGGGVALNGLAGNAGGPGNGGGEAGQGGAGNAGGAGDGGAGGGVGAGGAGAGGAGAGAGAGVAGGGDAATSGATAGGGEGGGTPPPATASAPTSPTSTTIPLTTLTEEEALAIAAVQANNESNSSGQPINTVIEAGGVDDAIVGIPSVGNTLISADGSAFVAVTTAAASALAYGTYTINADGVWNYTLNNDNATVQALNDGGTLFDVFTVRAEGGASQVITVRIVGANDNAVIRGVTSAVLEGTMSTVDGSLTSVDVDNIGFREQTSIEGSNGHGIFTLNADGTWSYQNSLRPFSASSNTDSFVAVSADGTAEQIVTVSQFTGSQSQLTQYAVGAFAIGYRECLSCGDYLYGTFIPQSNMDGGEGGVVSITPGGFWQFTQLTLPTISDRESINNFSLPFEYSVDGTIYTKNIDLEVSVENISNRYFYSTSFTYPDDATSLSDNYYFETSFTGQHDFDSTDHMNLIGQGVISGLTGVVSSDEENIGALIVDSYGNYTYVINQVPVNAAGQYTSSTTTSYDTSVLYNFTTIFYQNSNHVDTFNVIRDGASSTQSVLIGNTTIGMVINDKPGGIDYSEMMTVEGNLGLVVGSQNFQIISGAGSSNFYATNIGSLTLNTDGSYTYVITPAAVSAWESPDVSIASHVDTFLVSYSVGNTLNIQALEFNILQENNTQFIGSSGSTAVGKASGEIFLFDYGIPNDSSDSYSHSITGFDVYEDRINISKLLTSSSDLLSGTIYIDPTDPTGSNDRSEIRVNHSGSDFTVIQIEDVAASIPELMWNDETKSGPVTSLNAVTSWTETINLSGVSYDALNKKFTTAHGWAMKIVSGEFDPTRSDSDTLAFTGGAGEVEISQTIGGFTNILQDISHVDRINWSA